MRRGQVDLYVGNTDRDWFDILKAETSLTEVNHWQPSGLKFKVLAEGGIFFFRLKSPINKIAGFGLLASAENASIKLLWESIGVANGVASLDEFVARVKHYRQKNGVRGFVDEATQVGFKLLVEPTFLDEKDWFDEPSDWSPQIVVGKSYSSGSDSGQLLLSEYQRLASPASGRNSIARKMLGFNHPPQAGFIQQQAKQRTGQNVFKLNLLYAYSGKCAVSGCNIEEVLEAAHIRPFSQAQDHAISNGLLLRKDIHALFDRGLLIIDDDYIMRLSEQFRQLYGLESEYQKFEGKRLSIPSSQAHRPDLEALAEHRLKSNRP